MEARTSNHDGTDDDDVDDFRLPGGLRLTPEFAAEIGQRMIDESLHEARRRAS